LEEEKIMSKSPIYPSSSHNHYWVRQSISKRWDDIFRLSGSINPFERWADDNYVPQTIPVKQYDTDIGFVVMAELSGYESPDVHVDIHRDCLIILASRDGEGSAGERYCEVPLPSGIKGKQAEVEFSEGLLTVSFTKSQPRVLAWMRAIGQSLNPFKQPQNQAIPS
jgi:HSP20 family molecular chaperone IbpA